MGCGKVRTMVSLGRMSPRSSGLVRHSGSGMNHMGKSIGLIGSRHLFPEFQFIIHFRSRGNSMGDI